MERKVRVVVFTSGPVLERGVQEFLILLEEHPQIELLACIAHSSEKSRVDTFARLWKRRGILAVPIVLAQIGKSIWNYLLYPRSEFTLLQKISKLPGQVQLVPDIHHPSVLEHVRSLAPDIGLIYGSPILKPALFEIPESGTLGIHHGRVPEYRGKKTMFWAMYNREQTAGVTIQRVNKGLDTGLIIKQGEVPIGRRFPSAVWRDLHKLGLELYIQAILEVWQGKASFQEQAGNKGNLYKDPKIQEILKLWQRIIISFLWR